MKIHVGASAIESIVFCCDRMSRGYENGQFRFVPGGKANLRLGELAIDFCPFCGAEIEVTQDKEGIDALG